MVLIFGQHGASIFELLFFLNQNSIRVMVLKQLLYVSISILFCYLQYMSYLYNGSAGIFVHVELVFLPIRKIYMENFHDQQCT